MLKINWREKQKSHLHTDQMDDQYGYPSLTLTEVNESIKISSILLSALFSLPL